MTCFHRATKVTFGKLFQGVAMWFVSRTNLIMLVCLNPCRALGDDETAALKEAENNQGGSVATPAGWYRTLVGVIFSLLE